MRYLTELAFLGLVVASIYEGVDDYYGETVVRATLDGKPVKSQVSINDQYVGDTPYKAHLGAGHFHISVLPPDGVDTKQTEYTWEMTSVVLGMQVTAPFKSE